MSPARWPITWPTSQTSLPMPGWLRDGPSVSTSLRLFPCRAVLTSVHLLGYDNAQERVTEGIAVRSRMRSGNEELHLFRPGADMTNHLPVFTRSPTAPPFRLTQRD